MTHQDPWAREYFFVSREMSQWFHHRSGVWSKNIQNFWIGQFREEMPIRKRVLRNHFYHQSNLHMIFRDRSNSIVLQVLNYIISNNLEPNSRNYSGPSMNIDIFGALFKFNFSKVILNFQCKLGAKYANVYLRTPITYHLRSPQSHKIKFSRIEYYEKKVKLSVQSQRKLQLSRSKSKLKFSP